MFNHAINLAKRITKELYRDELFVVHCVVGPLATLFIVKVVAESVAKIPFLRDFMPMDALSVGFVALIIHFNGYVLCTLVIIRERISGTLERAFMATYERSEILFGYLLGYSTVILIQTIITLAASYFFFNITYGKNLPWIFMMIFLLGVVSIGLAMFVSNFARRESHAMVAIPLILLPAFLLSGLIFPIDILQKSLQIFSYIFPLRYAVVPMQRMILEGQSFWAMKFDVLGLLIYGAVTLVLGTITLKDRE